MQAGSRTAIWMWDLRRMPEPSNAQGPSVKSPRTVWCELPDFTKFSMTKFRTAQSRFRFNWSSPPEFSGICCPSASRIFRSTSNASGRMLVERMSSRSEQLPKWINAPTTAGFLISPRSFFLLIGIGHPSACPTAWPKSGD